MGYISLADYLASRPTTSDFGDDDKSIVLQDGAVKRMDKSGMGIVSTVLIDTTTTPLTSLPASGEVVYKKTNAAGAVAAFAVSVIGQTMCQELQNGLAGQDEFIRVKLIGTTWYRTG